MTMGTEKGVIGMVSVAEAVTMSGAMGEIGQCPENVGLSKGWLTGTIISMTAIGVAALMIESIAHMTGGSGGLIGSKQAAEVLGMTGSVGSHAAGQLAEAAVQAGA